jgi:NAD(P)-dependent dehydrogenase (short-subunit alcohol dehydrogenase family)
MFEFSPPENFLSGKTLLITGASDGIGKQCAKTFAEFGAQLILLGRNQEKLEALYDELEQSSPGQAVIQPMDFTTAHGDEYTNLASSLGQQFDCLDGLIHSAALLGPRTPIEFYPDSDWDKLLQVNITAPFLLTKALLPILAQSSDARVLFLSSSVGRVGRAHWGAYAVTKFAIEGLMQTLADEISNTTQIKVNSLNPGATRTSMRRDAYPAEDPSTQPEPAALMPVFLYLLSQRAANIQGQALNAQNFDPGN